MGPEWQCRSDHVLYSSVVNSHDNGFISHAVYGDEDPTDVLVIMHVSARVIKNLEFTYAEPSLCIDFTVDSIIVVRWKATYIVTNED